MIISVTEPNKDQFEKEQKEILDEFGRKVENIINKGFSDMNKNIELNKIIGNKK